MPVNNFSTGKDQRLVIQTPQGQLPLDAAITNFDAKPMTTKIKSKGMDGVARHGTIPDGWSGSFRIDRFSPAADNFWAAFEQGYFNGQNQQSGTIYQTIREADGSITEWRFTGVVLSFDDSGSWAGDKRVEQSVSFEAERRIKVV